MNNLPLHISSDFYQSLNDAQKQTLVLIDGWPMQKILEKIDIKNLGGEKELDAVVWYKQFIFLRYLSKVGKFGIYSKAIDEVWHTHILFTQDYLNFCMSVFGEFLHHAPCNIMKNTNESSDKNFEWQKGLARKFDKITVSPRIPPYCQG
ncbi:hypothetical protein GTP46_22975 [Duganella sp. FT135W]|uniref:Uncharacterized protein n=1 Tax=Duganella flavida TaxID=2692175 RepID=A0A6L8KH19_9BURK|nr:hypothetical protein [Duganella flavida]MYM25498.1 hypothetical protein [Duganella flavida]